ncbi:unnamed protein product, partial [Cladocopium goreaui]
CLVRRRTSRGSARAMPRQLFRSPSRVAEAKTVACRDAADTVTRCEDAHAYKREGATTAQEDLIQEASKAPW